MMTFRHSLLFSLVFVAASVLAAPVVQTGKADQKQISLTIYERDLAMVRDVRQLPLQNGDVNVRFGDISERIQPETVMLKNLSSGKLTVDQICFDNNLLSKQTLLDHYVGKMVRVVRTNPVTGTETEEPAQILSVRNGIVLKIGDRIETDVPGRIVFDRIPEGLHGKPVLTVGMTSKNGGGRRLELDYLTNGISWSAHYIARLNEKENRMNVSGWAVVSNNSGTEYREAKVQLIAGNPNVAMARPVLMAAAARSAKLDAMPVSNEASQESFADYHLYTLPYRITLSNDQTRQYALLNSDDVRIVRKWVMNGASYYYRNRLSNAGDRLPVDMEIAFRNIAGDGLGVPLPGGTIRFYQTDDRGDQQFLGESRMSHTPVDGTVNLKIGESFDVTGSRKQTRFELLPSKDQATRKYESAYEIVLKNAKNKSVTVQIREPIPGDWRVLQENYPHVRDGMMAVWNIRVPANGQSILSYHVRVE